METHFSLRGRPHLQEGVILRTGRVPPQKPRFHNSQVSYGYGTAQMGFWDEGLPRALNELVGPATRPALPHAQLWHLVVLRAYLSLRQTGSSCWEMQAWQTKTSVLGLALQLHVCSGEPPGSHPKSSHTQWWPFLLPGRSFSSCQIPAELRVLTDIREHPDAALHGGFLARCQPVAVVNTEHTLQQLYKDRLAGLKGRGATWRLLFVDY